jgi:hypothetical protein
VLNRVETKIRRGKQRTNNANNTARGENHANNNVNNTSRNTNTPTEKKRGTETYTHTQKKHYQTLPSQNQQWQQPSACRAGATGQGKLE